MKTSEIHQNPIDLQDESSPLQLKFEFSSLGASSMDFHGFSWIFIDFDGISTLVDG